LLAQRNYIGAAPAAGEVFSACLRLVLKGRFLAVGNLPRSLNRPILPLAPAAAGLAGAKQSCLAFWRKLRKRHIYLLITQKKAVFPKVFLIF